MFPSITMCYVENAPIATHVIWTRISTQQTQALKWIVLLEFTWLEMVDIYKWVSQRFDERWDICKIDVKDNISS